MDPLAILMLIPFAILGSAVGVTALLKRFAGYRTTPCAHTSDVVTYKDRDGQDHFYCKTCRKHI
jgi:hypothetical protein